MKLYKNFTSSVLIISGLVSAMFGAWVTRSANRNPSDTYQGYVLEINKMALASELGIVSSLENIYMRVSVDTSAGKENYDYFKTKTLSIHRGEEMDLNLLVDIKPQWLQDDQFKFSIEIKQPRGLLFDYTLVRCAFISRKISEFNRSYTCSLPKPLMSSSEVAAAPVLEGQANVNSTVNPDVPFLTYKLYRREANVASSN